MPKPAPAGGQRTEHRERKRKELSEALQIFRGESASAYCESDGMKKHGSEGELLGPIRVRPRGFRA
jgi:hypothetical protein